MMLENSHTKQSTEKRCHETVTKNNQRKNDNQASNKIYILDTTAEVLIMDTDVFMINNFAERHLWTNLRELRRKVEKRAFISS